MPEKKNTSKKKGNLLKLYGLMNRMVRDAVDKEVVKRFKTIIDTSEEDISKTMLRDILKDYQRVEISSFREALQPYIKHYVFMMKRSVSR
jgi:hypothetical protein